MEEELEKFVIKLNVTAPMFVLKDIFGRMIDLKAYKGKKVYIGFFRHAGCPFCNLRVHTMMKVQDELKAKNLEMIFFFESKENVMLVSSFHREVSPVPIIADPDKVWYSIYGLENSFVKSAISHLTSFIQTAVQAKSKNLPLHLMAGNEAFSTMPAEFLLDENLIIRKIHFSQMLTDRLSVNVIREFAEANTEDIVRDFTV